MENELQKLKEQLFSKFTPKEMIWPYSIDESILDMTKSWHLFDNSVRSVARLIQKDS